jgi:hypothetical protein
MVVHKFMMKQYLPQKQVKKGYKVLMLFDKSGYAWEFEVYTRSKKGVVKKQLRWKSGQNSWSEYLWQGSHAVVC